MSLRCRFSQMVLSLWLLSMPTAAPSADEAGSAAWAGGEDVEAIDDQALFVIGNTLFTVYHELGHALIDLLNLPVIGREEDAVDGFAAVTMIPDAPDALGDALIVAVADAWRAQSDVAAAEQSVASRGRAYWGEHALDEQRHFAIVCLMVGSDQDGFYDLALGSGLPDARIDSCSEDFRRMRDGWERLLAPHRKGAVTRAAEAAPQGAPITLAFDRPMPDQHGLLALIREKAILEDALDDFAGDLVLPSPVTIRFTSCAHANAYWSRDRHEVTICYELIDEFDAILVASGLR